MIIHKANDGSIAITMFVEGISDEQKVEAIARFKEMHPGKYNESYEGEYQLPESGIFRDAWTLNNNKIVIDDNKAKEIHLTRIRRVRNIELEKLDKEQLRHLTTPGMVVEIEAKKQILRDLPQNHVWEKGNISSPAWPDELPPGEIK
jgi:hypothetical protein